MGKNYPVRDTSKMKVSYDSTLDIIKTFTSNEIFHLDSVKQNVTSSLTHTTPCRVINLEIRSWRKDRNRCGFHHNYDNKNIILGWINLWWKYVKIWEFYAARLYDTSYHPMDNIKQRMILSAVYILVIYLFPK